MSLVYYYVANGQEPLLFSRQKIDGVDAFSLEVPEELSEKAEQNLPASVGRYFAFVVDSRTGRLTEIPKVTDERKEIFDIFRAIEGFIGRIEDFDRASLGPLRAPKIVAALDRGEVLGGTDVHNTYDSCTFGGALLKLSPEECRELELKSYVFGVLTAYDSGARSVVPIFNGDRAVFEAWISDQSEYSLARGPSPAKATFARNQTLNESLIKDVRKILD
ncbi:MAG: hypothetical protein V4760_04260 [Bdellovibrionota bacterium]